VSQRRFGQLQADPPRALDLALQGIKAAHTAEAQTALRDSVRVSVLRAVLPPMKAAVEAASRSADGGGGLGQVAFSPSGQYVALANTSGGVEVWHWGARSGLGSYGHPYHLALVICLPVWGDRLFAQLRNQRRVGRATD
jgi:hypothetical protein